MDKYFLPIEKKDAKEGDILLFNMNRGTQHLAIITDIGIIHSYAQVKSVVEHHLHDSMKNKIIGYYRFVRR